MYYDRSNDPIQDFMNDAQRKAEAVLDEQIKAASEDARQSVCRKYEVPAALAVLDAAFGVKHDMEDVSRYFGNSSDSPVGKAIKKATDKLLLKKQTIQELHGEYRIRIKLGKDPDGKMAMLHEFASQIMAIAKK